MAKIRTMGRMVDQCEHAERGTVMLLEERMGTDEQHGKGTAEVTGDAVISVGEDIVWSGPMMTARDFFKDICQGKHGALAGGAGGGGAGGGGGGGGGGSQSSQARLRTRSRSPSRTTEKRAGH